MHYIRNKILKCWRFISNKNSKIFDHTFLLFLLVKRNTRITLRRNVTKPKLIVMLQKLTHKGLLFYVKKGLLFYFQQDTRKKKIENACF